MNFGLSGRVRRLQRAGVGAVLVLSLGLASVPPALAGGAPALPPLETIGRIADRSQADRATLDYGLRALAVAPGVWVVQGAVDDFELANGCNIINVGIIATTAGAVVVNTGPSASYGQQLRALVRATTGSDVAAVVQLNLHPDYFFGHQAFADVPRWATQTTLAGLRREAAAYETNLFRLCGDWMKGTETLLPDKNWDGAVQSGTFEVGGRMFELVEGRGHTDSDVVLVDRQTGVVFAGGLVFADRIPTTPHAHAAPWLESLQRLQQRLTPDTIVVPSHGPVHRGVGGVVQTRAFLEWLDGHFRQAAEQGMEMTDLLAQGLPAPFSHWAAARTEYVRIVAHWYPRYERAALQRPR